MLEEAGSFEHCHLSFPPAHDGLAAIDSIKKPHKPFVSRNQLKKSPFLDGVTPARLGLALKKAVRGNKIEQVKESLKERSLFLS